jgi:hypothetical protein
MHLKAGLSCFLVGATVLTFAPAVTAQQVSKAECISSYSQAQDLRKGGQLLDARRQLLVCVRDSCPVLLRQDCASWLSEVEALIPSIVLAVRDDQGHDLVGVSITIDGKPVTSLDGRPIELEPGEHVLLFSRDRHSPSEQKIVVREGEKARAIVATLPSDAAAPPYHEMPPTADSAIPTGTWIFGAVAVAGLGSAIALGAIGLPTWNRCHQGGCSSSDKTTVDDLWLGADIGGATAIVGTALAVYFLLSRPSRPLVVEPRVGADRAGMVLRGTF